MNKPIGIKTISKSAHIRIIVVSLLLLSGCQSLYYKTMSKLGKEKRDILVARVKESKKDQEKTKEQIQTTMEKFQQLTGFQGGDLEKQYKQLNSEYERAEDQANKLRDRIKSIDQVSGDMFTEWQKEIDQMSNAQLKSRRQATYMKAMQKTEAQMTPVLSAFHDQVLFLKHNLNARAVGSLKTTAATMNTDVNALIKSIDTSMQEADKLVSSLSKADQS